MPFTEEDLINKSQTVRKIFQYARKYSGDLDEIYIQKNGRKIALSSLSLSEFFDFVKNIPYQRDRKPIEVIARPKIIIQRYQEGLGKDCKKAALLLGAYFERHGIPWRIATVSTRDDKEIHHVFTQVDPELSGQFFNADATYSYMKLFQPKSVTKVEYFTP